MSESLRHAILGAGGVGGMIGACLARSGAPVTLVLKPESIRSYPEQLQLESSFGNVSVPVSRALEIPPVDVLWIAVKATQLEAALPAIKNAESVRGILPLLNGIDHLKVLRNKYGVERVIAATIAVETERIAPGKIVHRSPFARLNVASAGRNLLGATIEELQKIGFECRFIDNEATLMWTKLCFLAPLALATTSANLTTGGLMASAHWRGEVEACIREATSVAKEEGAQVDPRAIFEGMQKLPGGMKSSMQKDVEQGNVPELDAIAGPVLRGGERHGIETPAFARLAAEVRRRAGI